MRREAEKLSGPCLVRRRSPSARAGCAEPLRRGSEAEGRRATNPRGGSVVRRRAATLRRHAASTTTCRPPLHASAAPRQPPPRQIFGYVPGLSGRREGTRGQLRVAGCPSHAPRHTHYNSIVPRPPLTKPLLQAAAISHSGATSQPLSTLHSFPSSSTPPPRCPSPPSPPSHPPSPTCATHSVALKALPRHAIILLQRLTGGGRRGEDRWRLSGSWEPWRRRWPRRATRSSRRGCSAS